MQRWGAVWSTRLSPIGCHVCTAVSQCGLKGLGHSPRSVCLCVIAVCVHHGCVCCVTQTLDGYFDARVTKFGSPPSLGMNIGEVSQVGGCMEVVGAWSVCACVLGVGGGVG
jgi:hypothetical protein